VAALEREEQGRVKQTELSKTIEGGLCCLMTRVWGNRFIDTVVRQSLRNRSYNARECGGFAQSAFFNPDYLPAFAPQ
jgi:hypothetical protein